jgi:hypothetical protein
MPEEGTPEHARLVAEGSPLLQDRWIRYGSVLPTPASRRRSPVALSWSARFAVANIGDEAVMLLRPRLQAINYVYGLV